MICYLFDAPSYIFFAPDTPAILYYSHIPATVLALLIGLFVYLNGRNFLLNRLLLVLSIVFSAWTLNSLFGWTNIHADFLAFAWPIYAISSSLLAIFSIYFTYVFIDKKDIKLKYKIIFLVLLLPILLFAHTNLSISGFNITNCDAFDYEGLPFKYYYTALGFIAIVWIFGLLVKRYRNAQAEMKKQIILIGVGIEFFLFSFLTSTFIITYLVNVGILPDSRLEMYGLFGMIVFLAMISVLIVRFKTFNVGLLASQALVIALIALVGSQFTYVHTTPTIILTSITLIFTGLIGIALIRSVQKEVQQRIELEKLTTQLEKANERLKELDKLKSEFVSIASHQLRSPLTSIRGYASMLAEESFGKLPEKAIEPVKRIEDSARLMAIAVEDYLNVSRIEAGNMKYNMSNFNLKEEVEKIANDVRPVAMEKGLVLLFRSDMKSRGIVNADIGKTVQIIHNLINNSMKYTPKGSITVLAHDDVQKKRMYIDVIDTGIGINKENLSKLFQKFSRASNANSVNVSGTGLGLFVALRMAEAMGGTITAHSDGDGRGSRFTLELPLVV